MVKIWDKKTTQKILKVLRDAGYKVTKIAHGYEAHDLEGNEVFKAMFGGRGYLVRHKRGLFNYA